MQQLKSNQSEEYKETEVGLLPNSWNITNIDKIFHVKQGKQLSSKESKDGKIKKPFLRTSNVFWGKIDTTKVDYMYFTKDEFETLRLQDGDILICEGGDIGRTALYNGEVEETAYQNHLHRLRPKDNYIDKNYFVLWMNHAINQRKMYISDANRTTIPNLSSSRLKSFQFPLPLLPEQQKIAHVLSIIQDSKEKTENSINSFHELKNSLMKYLFTYGPVSLEEAEKVNLKETEAGQIPRDWDVASVSDVFEFSRKPRDLEIKDNEEIPFIPMEFISKSKRMARYEIKKLSKIKSGSFVFKDDLIVGKITPCFENGKQAILNNLSKGYGYATTEVWALHPKNGDVINEHLYEYLKIPTNRSDLAGKMEGSTGRQRLPRHVLANLKIPLPNVSIQEQIASILSAVDEKIEKLENKHNALDELFKSMLHNLMTAKIRVNNLEVENG